MIRVKIHSFIDVITNSSTEIYVMADTTTLQAAKEFVQYFLDIAESDKKAEDLFEFKLSAEDYDTDEEVVLNDTEKLKDFNSKHDYDYPYNCYLEIIPKDNSKETIELRNKLMNIFNVDAIHN